MDEHISLKSIKANLIILAVNAIVFVITDFFDFLGGSILISAGELSWQAVFQEGEIYRVVTCMFLHADAGHIGNNMLILMVVGTYLEQILGTIRYLELYFFSGIIAGFSSMVYNMTLGSDTASIGASGAVFGVMGGLLCVVLLYRKEIGLSDIRRMLLMVGLSLYLGFMSVGVDNAAHVGGFVGGFLVTGVLFAEKRWRKRREKKRPER